MYVMGGETQKLGPNASIGLSKQQTYDRVDVYHLEQNRWTQVRLLECIFVGITCHVCVQGGPLKWIHLQAKRCALPPSSSRLRLCPLAYTLLCPLVPHPRPLCRRTRPCPPPATASSRWLTARATSLSLVAA